MNKQATYWLAPLLFLSLALTACGGNDQKAAAGAPGAAGAGEVKDYPVITIVPQTTTLYSEYPATIQGQQNIEIRPKIDGYVDRIYVDEGATVRRGQPLFQISAPQYEQGVRTAEANIKIAQADVNAAQMQVEKVRPLVEKNIISQYELQSAQFTLQAKQAQLAQARATLANARTNLGYTSITSPVNGVVGTIPHKIGSLVSSTTPEPLTTVSNIGNIYAYFSINEKQALEFAKNTKGATSEERLASLPPVSLMLPNGSEFPQKGKVETASGLINTETGSISVRATFPNPGNIIRSGSSGVVRIPQTVDSAIVIPQKSTYEIQGKRFVYVLESTGTVRSAEVQVMESSNGKYFVAEEGLNPGDRIVLEGIATLREGAPIKVRPVNVDSLYRSLLQ
ncbi:efflux RND transporter periplasmic adaptor subunit [Paracnuella aquatica]|uniref:efflux RND transporter periplasmic adaptor subunit n=1 Tax=Paracnuella aquatica TaxID=2268757 RepID=UPI000DEFB136|nr:efflux RND transporter periplasmic adaptor subunit [Paracnuella aquatica]RPD45121.1 efflux RND transporter periplasmic adaptor subunit [Paracnuella aquatica]